MELLSPVINVITVCLACLSIVILLWGIIVCTKDFFVSRFRIKDIAEKTQSLTDAKNQLGRYVLLSLEILIVADIITTIVQPTLEDIIRLGAIVAIRTVISYFLNREMQLPRMISKKD